MEFWCVSPRRIMIFFQEPYFSLKFFLSDIVMSGKSGPEGQQGKLESSDADIHVEQPLESHRIILLLWISGVSFALPLCFCLHWS